MNPALTWEELATFYDKTTGRRARIQPMDVIFEWAEKRPELVVHPKHGTIHFKEQGNG